jgi:hypothetical protein
MAAKKPAKAETQPAEPGIYLDPKLAEIRDAEMARLEKIVVTPREDATIDPALVKLRDAEIKRGNRTL